MGDTLTVLRCSANLTMAKRWLSDGNIVPYSSAKHFTASPTHVHDIHELSEMLTILETDPQACVIRGTPKSDVDLNRPVRRLLEHFDDKPLHTILIEIDGYRPLISDPLHEPQDSALEFIVECLPEPFHDASFHWQLSNSAGAPGKEGLFKAHLWFWLETPYDSATLKAWAKSESLQIDTAVFNPVQVHYTAAPVIEPGASCPVTQRSGFYRGRNSAVSLHINTDLLRIRPNSIRVRSEDLDLDDPVADFLAQSWEVWGEAGGGISITCPFEDGHSGGVQGDSSTVYFPAGTGGYTSGFFKCLHSSCEDRTQECFQQAVGWSDNRMASLAETQDISSDHASPPLYLNGHVINDPLVLPPFARDKSGGILVTSANIQMALRHPKACAMDLRRDTFREETMYAEHGSDEWRPFTDTNYTDLKLALEKCGFANVPRDELRAMVLHRACENSFDTAQAWLDPLVWDGVPRIETFWIDHFGVPDDEAGYARAVGRYTWSAMAGRIVTPGVQADMTPILTGPQGIGKSRGIAAMSPVPEFATTMSFHEPEVERTRKMRGVLVVELAELQGLKSRDLEEIKAWMTRTQEHWTPKWMEASRMFLRRFLMFGTTNADDFLDDPTGERRCLPIAVGRRFGFKSVDVDAIISVRDQLWAEGREMYAKHGVMWQDAERLARGEHGNYKAEDTWRDAVSRWLDRGDMSDETPRGKPFLSTLEVAEGALGLAPRLIKYADQRRIAKILHDEGYVPIVRRVGGKPTKVWGRDAG